MEICIYKHKKADSPVADPALTSGLLIVLDCFFSEGSSRDLLERVWSGAFVNGVGDVGKDKGDDNLKCVVGVPKVEGKDCLDSEFTKAVASGIAVLSVASVHRTVGKDILRELLRDDDSSSCSVSDITIWKEKRVK